MLRSASAAHRRPGGRRRWARVLGPAAVLLLAAAAVGRAGPPSASLPPALQVSDEEWNWGTVPYEVEEREVLTIPVVKEGRLTLINKCGESRTVTVTSSPVLGSGFTLRLSGDARRLAKTYTSDANLGDAQAQFDVPASGSLAVDVTLTRDRRMSLEELMEGVRAVGKPYPVGRLRVEHQGTSTCLPRQTTYIIRAEDIRAPGTPGSADEVSPREFVIVPVEPASRTPALGSPDEVPPKEFVIVSGEVGGTVPRIGPGSPDEVPPKEFVIAPGEVKGTIPRTGLPLDPDTLPPEEKEKAKEKEDEERSRKVGLVPKRPVVDVSENPTAVNAVDGRRDPAVQMMILESLETVQAFGSAAGGEPDEIEAGARVHGPAVGPSNAGGDGQDLRPGEIRIFLTSLGSSTGEAIEAYAFATGAGPVALAGAGLVLEPLDAAASARAQRLLQDRLQRTGGGPPPAARLNAYCLEFRGAPPDAGAVFRLAPAEVQRRFAPARRILHAAEQLRDAGRLSPDSDATAYFHAIRQWAIWAEERNLDLESFGGAFVERTRENLQRMGQAWSDEIEKTVRARVPGRWRDVRNVLEEAARSGPRTPGQNPRTDSSAGVVPAARPLDHGRRGDRVRSFR